jgi:curved DNA-binding protein CbpA
MPDYYEMLGVEADADVDDIRSAYRDKRAEAIAINEKAKDQEKEAERARSEAARLNKAWNVLSDPYQRGRYDQERAQAVESGDEDAYDDEDDVTPVRRQAKAPAKTGGNKRSTAGERREAKRNAPPTVTLPEGMYFPKTKRRIIAMAIDLAVLLVFFIGSQLLVVQLEKSNHKAAYDRVTELNNNEIPDAHTATTKASKTASAADDAYTKLAATKGKNDSDTQTALENKQEKDKARDDAKAAEKKLNDELAEQQKQLAPTQNVVSGAFFLLSLLVLLIPSFFGGQTLGKRIQHVRLVRVDGSPLKWTDVFRRYTALVFAAYVLSTFLRSPVGALIVVFVSTLWTRNPNQQALQDKFAKTLVLTEIEE